MRGFVGEGTSVFPYNSICAIEISESPPLELTLFREISLLSLLLCHAHMGEFYFLNILSQLSSN